MGYMRRYPNLGGSDINDIARIVDVQGLNVVRCPGKHFAVLVGTGAGLEFPEANTGLGGHG